MKKNIIRLLLLILAAILIILLFNASKIDRLVHTISLFDEDVIAENFQNMEDSYPVRTLTASTQAYQFPERKEYMPAGSFTFENKTYNIPQYLKDTRTEGLLILKNDTIIHESYYEGLEQNESHISWSMAKSFTSALVGILHDQGLFDLDDPVTKYLPDFKGTGYDGVTIINLLNMSSGVRFNEDYGDFYSDINRFGRAFAMGSSIREFAKSLKNERPQGTYNHYVSIDTQVLGLLLMAVSGKTITELTQQYLWTPLGMEYDGQWIIDNKGDEIALGGLNATLRDYTKMGVCFKNDGYFNNQQIVPKEWVKASIDLDKPHLQAGVNELSSNIHGYGLQWWVPVNNPDAFAMGGIYNQYVYIDPVNDIVITKLSANHKYKKEGHVTKAMHFVMFDAMIQDIVNSTQAIN